MLKSACQFVRMIRPRMIRLAEPHKPYCNDSVSRMEDQLEKLPNNYIMPVGEILTDYFKETKWQVEEFLGGPGNIGNFYKVSLVDSRIRLPKSVRQHAVVKMEKYAQYTICLNRERMIYHELRSIAKDWIKSQKLEYLPIPQYVCWGTHVHKTRLSEDRHKFMVLEQCGNNITDLLKRSANGKFNTKTLCYIALRMLEVLECIHSTGRPHGDINGCNIVTGYSPADKHKVYLIDYGTSIPYEKNEYYVCPPEFEFHHNWGTLGYMSIDVHNGAYPARRGDMETLGYSLMEWAGVEIPWMDYSYDEADTIAMEKKRFKSDLLAGGSTSIMSIDGTIPEYILTYMCAAYEMEYLEKPDYKSLKNIFRKTLEENNLKDDKNDLDWITATSA